MWAIGDTKAGTLVGTDRMGNKFYENLTEELPLRVRIGSANHPQNESTRHGTHTDKQVTDTVDRIRQLRARRLTHRPGLARVDLVPGRQAAPGGQYHEDWLAAVGEPESEDKLYAD